MILTTVIASEANICAIRKWLAVNCPRWSGFRISNVGKYLGFQMGPLGGEVQWKEPLEKLRVRTREIKTQNLPLAIAASRFAIRALPVLGYKAQLCPPPPLFSQLELWAAHKILGIPLALDLNAVFGLEILGGTKIIRPSHYMRACMLRAASKTIVGFDGMHDKLASIAGSGARCIDYARFDFRPPGWQANAFATNLLLATKGNGIGLDVHANPIALRFASLNAGNRIGLSARQSKQSALYAFLQSLTPPNWHCTLNRKMEAFDCLEDLAPFTSSDILLLAPALKKCGPRIAMSVIKSWANAWTTSARMHEAYEFPCIFGCQGCEDDLEHYLVCDPLWTIVISCSSGQSELLHAGPHSKFGFPFSAHSIAWWKMLAIAFSCYHAIKMGHRDEVLFCSESGNFCQVLDRLLEYACVFSRELTDG